MISSTWYIYLFVEHFNRYYKFKIPVRKYKKVKI